MATDNNEEKKCAKVVVLYEKAGRRGKSSPPGTKNQKTTPKSQNEVKGMTDEKKIKVIKDEPEFPRKKYRVLLIDDNYEFFQIMQIAMEPYMEIDYAGDGFTAFQMVKKQKYDIFLCDILMPMMNGIALLIEFKKKNINTPFLFITGNANDKVIKEAFKNGAYNIMEKPFDKDELLQKVETAIALHQEEEPEVVSDQDKAYIYNTLKTYYYDVDKIMRIIQQINMPVSSIHAELEKKVMTGRCAFDDLQNLRHIKHAS